MTAQYISQDLEWTEAMKDSVRRKVIDPLYHHLRCENFEVSVHLGLERKRILFHQPKYVMWIVLQTFDGRGNEVVRGEHEKFLPLVHQVSRQMRTRLPKARLRRRFFANPFRRQAVGINP